MHGMSCANLAIEGDETSDLCRSSRFCEWRDIKMSAAT